VKLRAWLDVYERRVFAFGVSLWSTFALVVYGIVWVVAEAFRGKWIGWDGFITLALGEVALATLRSLKRKADD
jgi:membrane-bound ClpP family serine protease